MLKARLARVAIILACFSGSPSWAQAPTGSPPDLSGYKKVIQNADPETVRVVNEYFDVIFSETMWRDIIAGMADLSTAAARKNAGSNAQQQSRIREIGLDEAAKFYPEMKLVISALLLQTFSVDELKAIRDFYLSDIGRQIAAKNAAAMKKVAEAIQPFAVYARPILEKNVRARLEAEGLIKKPANSDTKR